MRIGRVAKAVVAGVGTVVTVLTAAFADDVVSLDETATLVATLVTAAATVYGVYKVENKPAE